jgi:hypothetical protein
MAFFTNKPEYNPLRKENSKMNIRRLVLDVDKAIARPTLLDLAKAVESVTGVEGVNITVNEIDIETMGMEVTVEGENIDYTALVKAIESTGAVVHSIDQLAFGNRLVERVKI